RLALGAIALVGGLGSTLLGCKDGAKETAPAPTGSASASATSTATASASATASATASAAPAADPLPTMFAGPPDEARTTFDNTIKLSSCGMFMRIPAGWKSQDHLYTGMLITHAPDDAGVVMLHNGVPGFIYKPPKGDAEVDPLMDRWFNVAGVKEHKWGDYEEGHLGLGMLSTRLTRGTAEFKKQPAELWYIKFKTAKCSSFIAVAAVTKAASAKVRDQLIDVVKSIYTIDPRDRGPGAGKAPNPFKWPVK
ncbi:hypothetical protein JYT22_01025, partial [Endomicrobium sp. AH-315-J14]|nr:hypothetical protein [Endomicrobium sp. AH-315-J14]